jgi:hypothetical protein
VESFRGHAIRSSGASRETNNTVPQRINTGKCRDEKHGLEGETPLPRGYLFSASDRVTAQVSEGKTWFRSVLRTVRTPEVLTVTLLYRTVL